MEKKVLIIVLGLVVFGFFLFGCASQQSQGNETQTGTNKTNTTSNTTSPTDMTCEEYCSTQPHIMCVGEWNISGEYPNCNCQFTCTSLKEPEKNSSQNLNISAKVEIRGYKLSPESIEVAKGTTVTWTNNDGPAHSIVSDTGIFRSSLLVTGQTYNYTFDTAGTYTYHSEPHSFVKGTIIVK